MSNLSFARIMYGTNQQTPSPALMPLANSPSHLLAAPASGSARSASHPTVESLLHKAWLLFSHDK